MKVLFIWEQFTEALEFYEVTGRLAEVAAQCDGQYINADDLASDAAVYRLSDAVFYSSNGEKMPPHPEFVKVDHTTLTGPWDKIIAAGFLP